MKTQLMGAVLAAVLAGPAMAAPCTESFSLGSMGPPDGQLIGNQLASTGGFNDCYTFSVNSSTQLFGITLDWDLSSTRDIDLTSVSLSGGSLASQIVDNTPSYFDIGGLGAGTYLLEIAGLVNGWGSSGWVGYLGAITTVAGAPIASSVPEPTTYALMLAGLAAMGFVAVRRRPQ